MKSISVILYLILIWYFKITIWEIAKTIFVLAVSGSSSSPGLMSPTCFSNFIQKFLKPFFLSMESQRTDVIRSLSAANCRLIEMWNYVIIYRRTEGRRSGQILYNISLTWEISPWQPSNQSAKWCKDQSGVRGCHRDWDQFQDSDTD